MNCLSTYEVICFYFYFVEYTFVFAVEKNAVPLDKNKRTFCPNESKTLRSDSELSDSWTLFCPLQVKLGQIVYMHDSTETTEDSFTLSASAYEIERRSHPVAISITIIPVNDEPPKLTRNTGLEVKASLFDSALAFT